MNEPGYGDKLKETSVWRRWTILPGWEKTIWQNSALIVSFAPTELFYVRMDPEEQLFGGK
jgi:hypothetical protein